jgi:hypothetical protein
MNGLFEAALEVQEFIHKNHWRFCIIGGLAVVRWGQPRATQDVDVSLLTGFGAEKQYVDRLLSQFKGRIPEAGQFAVENRVVLAEASNGVAVDIALAGFPFEEQVIDRATAFPYASEVTLITASAEDMVVLKAFAGRDQDWADVRGIIERQTNRLDWNYITRELTGLIELKEDKDSLDRLEEIRRQASREA